MRYIWHQWPQFRGRLLTLHRIREADRVIAARLAPAFLGALDSPDSEAIREQLRTVVLELATERRPDAQEQR